MTNVKANRQLISRIISGGLSLFLVTSGYVLWKLASKNSISYVPSNITSVSDDELASISSDVAINQYLGDYIEKLDTLEKETSSLLEPKERPQSDETFNIENLIVMENTNENGESDLYILHVTNDSGTCYEFYMENTNENNEADSHILRVPKGDGTCYEHCNEFKTWFGLYLDIDEQTYDLWPGYIYCNNCQPLFDYLTDKEIETLSNNGRKITRLDLEKISARIRMEYKQQLSENNYQRSLTSN